jgi:hypothetical protein
MRTSRRRGVTLIETVVAASFSIIAITGAVMLFLSGAMAWTRGAGRIDAESKSHLAIRRISRELREAMKVVVDANGQGLTYQLPLKNQDGSYVQPLTPDNRYRRIELSGPTLRIVDGEAVNRICSGVVLTDPLSGGGSSPYKIFTPGSGSITRSLTVMVVSTRSADYNKTATSRSRETIYLRNIPQLVK